MSVRILVGSGSILQSVFYEIRIVEQVQAEFLLGHAILIRFGDFNSAYVH